MIMEIATIDVKPELAVEFETNVARAQPLFADAEGCFGMELHRVVEVPSRFMLVVVWESVAHHMEIFRNAPAFAEWRNLIGHCLASPPQVIHTERVIGPS